MKPGALLIRADANVTIGTGHVMRCLALAQAWQESGGVTSLAAAELPEMLSPRLATERIAVIRLDVTPGSLGDAADTIAHAHQLSAEWVAIDGDRFQSDFLEAIRNADLKLLLIDDFADRESFPTDLVVNPNPGADVEVYRKRGFTASVLTGTPYVMLRREFRQPFQSREFREKGNRILVTLGGSDPEELTPRIAVALAECGDLEITAVAGPGYSKLGSLRAFEAPNLRVVFDSQDMVELMRSSDVAIIAAGGTLWELLSVGCAVLSYSRNAVQARVVRDLANRGAVLDMGDTRSFDPAKLRDSVNGLAGARASRERMATLGRALVDGLGATRVVEAMRRSGAC